MAANIKHFLQFKDFTREEFEYLFERTRIIKERFKRYEKYWPLEDRTLVMIFEKASTRTRLSFEAGMHQLGGSAIYLNTRDSQLGRGEPVEDAVQVISRIIDDGMPLPKALAAPRVYMGGGTLEAETSPFTGWTPEQVAEMRALGLEVRENPGVGSFSRVHAIQYDPATNTWTAGADPDWEGSAQGPNRGRRPGGPAR